MSKKFEADHLKQCGLTLAGLAGEISQCENAKEGTNEPKDPHADLAITMMQIGSTLAMSLAADLENFHNAPVKSSLVIPS